MKLPNWLHRKPDFVNRDEWANVPDKPWSPLVFDAAPPPNPYLNSLAKKSEEPLWLSDPPESVEGAHTRGYWEGRAEAASKYRVEVLQNDADSIDEVLLLDADRCLFHLERLDTDHWWLTLSPTGGWDDEVVFDLFRVKKCIEVTEQ